MIKIKIRPFDGKHTDLTEHNFTSHNSPLLPLIKVIVDQLNTMTRLQSPRFKLPKNLAAKDVNFPPPDGNIEIDLVLIDDPELADYWDAPANSLGWHCINAGAYELIDGDVLSDGHRVAIKIDESQLKQFILDERLQESNPYSDRHDTDYLKAYLTTITHEIVHCLEFIEHSNGMTPHEVQNSFEGGELFLDLSDISTGHGILVPFNENNSRHELEDKMEYRVEEEGRALINQISIDNTLIETALKQYRPSRKTIKTTLESGAPHTHG